MPGIGIGVGIGMKKRGLLYPTAGLQVIVYNQPYEEEGTTYLRTSIGVGIPKVSGTGNDTIWDFSVLNDDRFDKSNATYWGTTLDDWFYYDALNPYHSKLKDFHYKNLNAQVTFDNQMFLKAEASENTSNVLVKKDKLLIYEIEKDGNDLIKLRKYIGIQSSFIGENLFNNFDFEVDLYPWQNLNSDSFTKNTVNPISGTADACINNTDGTKGVSIYLGKLYKGNVFDFSFKYIKKSGSALRYKFGKSNAIGAALLGGSPSSNTLNSTSITTVTSSFTVTETSDAWLILFTSLATHVCFDDFSLIGDYQDYYKKFTTFNIDEAVSINASLYGFSTTADAATNVTALQNALNDGFKEVVINEGTYDLNSTILLDSYTRIKGIGNVTLKKTSNYSHVFVNKGGTLNYYDDSIYIDNINIDTNSTIAYSGLIKGNLSHLGFYHIKNLYLSNMGFYNGESVLFSIKIDDFQNVSISDIVFESLKDGIKIGNGDTAIIDSCTFNTYDDATSIPGVDFEVHTVSVGDTSGVIIKNCTHNQYGVGVGGSFCRIMGASWEQWGAGKQYQRGDLCDNNGHLYQVANDTSPFTVASSVEEPIHVSGEVTGATDGIVWRYLHPAPTNRYVTIDNIEFDNITYNKAQQAIYVNLYNDAGEFLRAAYPGTEHLSTITNLVIKNNNYSPVVGVESELPFIITEGNLLDFKILNSTLKSAYYIYKSDNDFVFDRNVTVEISGCLIEGDEMYFRSARNAENIYCTGSDNTVNNARLIGAIGGEPSTFRVNNDTLLLRSGEHLKLSPEIGDRCLTTDGIYEYTSEGWVLQS